MGLAIPLWIFDEDYRTILIPGVMLTVIALGLYLHMLKNNIMYNCANGISIDSKAEMHNMIVCILLDNSSNQVGKGFNS